MDMHKQTKDHDSLSLKKIVLIYLITGYMWVIASDLALGWIINHRINIFETIKGVSFVTVTSALLAILLKKYIGQIVQAKHNAVASEEKYMEIFHTANDGIVILQLQDDEPYRMRILEVNEVFSKYVGDKPIVIANRSFDSYVVEKDKLNDIRRAIKEKSYCTAEVSLFSRANKRLPVEISFRQFQRHDENVIVAVVRDISERKRTEEHARYITYHDVPTGLPNGHSFYDMLYSKINDKAEFSVLVLHIERFELIQDAFGRLGSNNIMVQIAELLKRCVREDCQLFRMDNISFSMIVNYSQRAYVESIAADIKAQLEKPICIDGEEVWPEVYLGYAQYPVNGADTDKLIHHAYTALFHAKDVGVTYIFDEVNKDNDAKKKILLASELKKSLIDNQLELYFQPQLSLSSNGIIGVEALIRWKHPKLGIIPPADFIPIAEENGFILAIGKWVMYEACRLAKQMQTEHHLFVPISVNVSAKQFWHHELLDTIQDALQTSQLEARYLVLEITESITMKAGQGIQISTQLQQLGVKLSIDDFGTGFSSFAYLKRLPLSELKIDKSFIQDLVESKTDRDIVQSIISLAHHLQLDVVAEGVETEQQIACLIELGCDIIQGYYLSRPIPFEQLVELLKRHRAQSI